MSNIVKSELTQIESEIISLRNQAAQNLIKIGLKLIDAKKIVSHGEWGEWLNDKVGFSQRTASNLMRIAKELGNSQAISDLEATKIYMLMELPVEEREDFIQQNNLKNMSTREMKHVLKQYKRKGEGIYKIIDRVRDENCYEIDVDKLKPFPNHENYFWDIRGKDYVKFLESIEKSGVIQPILITRDNMIVSGHQRVRACKDLGIETISANYIFSENCRCMSLDEVLLDCFITSNMHTRSCVFYLALAWENLFFDDGSKVDDYLQKFIEYDNSEYNQWLEESREKVYQMKKSGNYNLKS